MAELNITIPTKTMTMRVGANRRVLIVMLILDWNDSKILSTTREIGAIDSAIKTAEGRMNDARSA